MCYIFDDNDALRVSLFVERKCLVKDLFLFQGNEYHIETIIRGSKTKRYRIVRNCVVVDFRVKIQKYPEGRENGRVCFSDTGIIDQVLFGIQKDPTLSHKLL